MNPDHQWYLQTSGGPNTGGNTPVLDYKDPIDFSGYAAQTTTVFKPGNIFDGMFSDMAIKSPDQTEFYVHRRHLSRVSTNGFAGLLTHRGFSISVPEPTVVLNIVVHTVYGMSSTHYNPSLDTIEAAIDALVKYGVAPRVYASSSSKPLHRLLLSHAPYRPIDAYALAGKYGFEDAAIAISAHLLAYDLSQISDALSIKMGPVYLRRLVMLHTGREDALKNIVLAPPETHPPTLMCADPQTAQAELTRAWAFAAAELAWAALPGMSTNALHSLFDKAGREIHCEDCLAALEARIRDVCSLWSQVKVGIFRVDPVPPALGRY
ncbi:hypothetical protein GSI_03615 [Ganoderma sinense ZZ0214-1]|uniref:BTB domain-containing protein n=1 Tax=Ganoderma sinense ZZ0214-1 TaxID=1077348 RepID=A0A2G8SJG3_9APHY|nr:hypothetical protein GSI_03615 [Ganoderma sinense ZZ0214-1]